MVGLGVAVGDLSIGIEAADALGLDLGRREHPVLVMTMSPRRGDQRGAAVEQLERGEYQRRLATRQEPGQRGSGPAHRCQEGRDDRAGMAHRVVTALRER